MIGIFMIILDFVLLNTKFLCSFFSISYLISYLYFHKKLDLLFYLFLFLFGVIINNNISITFLLFIIIGRHNVRTCLKYSIGTKAKTTLILSLSLKYIALFASASIIETGTFLTEAAYVSGRRIAVQSGVHDFDQRPGFAAVLPVRLRFAVVQDQHEFPAFPPVSRDTHSVKRPCITSHRGRLLHPVAL